MVLNSIQRLAAVKGLDVDKATGNARGSILNKQWPGGVMIYAVDPQIGKEALGGLSDRFNWCFFMIKNESNVMHFPDVFNFPLFKLLLRSNPHYELIRHACIPRPLTKQSN